MKFCIKCGHKLNDGNIYCPNCGCKCSDSINSTDQPHNVSHFSKKGSKNGKQWTNKQLKQWVFSLVLMFMGATIWIVSIGYFIELEPILFLLVYNIIGLSIFSVGAVLYHWI